MSIGRLQKAIIGLLFLLFGIAAMGTGFMNTGTAFQMQNEIGTTDGVVVSTSIDNISEIGSGGAETRYFPNATYEYTVNGEQYKGAGIYPSTQLESDVPDRPSRALGDYSDAEQLANEIGGERTVYYEKNNPRNSFLVEPDSYDYGAPAFSVMFFSPFLFIGIFLLTIDPTGGSVSSGDIDTDMDMDFDDDL